MKKKREVLFPFGDEMQLRLRKMKLTVLMTFLVLASFGNSFSQVTLSLSFSKANIHDVLGSIEKKTDYIFMYKDEILDDSKTISIEFKETKFEEVLKSICEQSEIDYEVRERQIILKEKANIPIPTDQQQPKKKEISGIVKDINGQSLPGVSVIVKGTTTGISTDAEGKFTLSVSGAKEVLVISFIGMKPTEVTITNVSTSLNIELEPDNFDLEAVVVTGYGNLKKDAYAGSVNIVKMDKLANVPVSNIANLLQGSASGVQVTNSSGQPGGSTQVRIRGTGSFNASNDPLYVIDGVPVISGNVSSLGTNSGLDILSTINPSSIESISVIKDAAAASLYGSRAANGVILITTKKGKSGTTKINFKTEFGYSDFASDYRPFMSGDERKETIFEGLVNEGIYYKAMDQTAATAYAMANIDKYAKLPWTGVWTDWKALLFRKGNFTDNEISISGGTDKIKYYSSLGYTDQEGISVMGYLKRLAGRLNLSYEASKRLNVGLNLMFSSVNQSTNTEGSAYVSPFYSVFNTVPGRDVPFNEDGSYASSFPRNGTGRNPKAYADLNYQIEDVIRVFNTVYADYKIMDGLNFKSSFSYDYNMTKGESFTHPLSSYPAVPGTLSNAVYDRRSSVWSNNVQYFKTFAQNHNFDALVAYEVTDYSRDYLAGSKENLANWNMVELDNFSVVRSVDGSVNGSRMISYISKVNYDFNKKYYAGFSFRRDGSSKLAPQSRWGNFWSLSGAWRVSDESFMKGITDIFPEIKLRSSYGVNGTLPSGFYDYMGLSSYGADYNSIPGIIETQFLNSNLKWETNYNTNIGLDLSILNIVRISVEYYNRLTKDLLMNEPTSLTTGFSSILSNIGQMRNRGVELELVSTIFNKKNFNWTTSFNIANNTNKILVLDGVQTSIISGSQIRMVGKPYNTYYLREFAGIDPADGMTWFYTNTLDSEGNYVKEKTKDLNIANAIPLQSAYPKVLGGLVNNFKIYFVDLGFTFTYSMGGYSYDSGAGKLDKEGTTNGLDANIPSYYHDRWRKPGDQSIYGIYIANNKWDLADGYSNSRRIHSTDHLRLKNITMGVTIPSRLTDRINLERARIFASANNSWTTAKWKMYDPEVGSDGVMAWQTPQLKTVAFGLELTF